MKNVLLSSFAALACMSGAAMADIGGTVGPMLVTSSDNSYAPRDASGIFGARMAVFNTAGAGAFYDDGTGGAGANLQNFGVTESMGLFSGRTINITSSMTALPSGNQLIRFVVTPADGNPFLNAGTTLAGLAINAIQLDIGTPNAPADPVDFDSPITVVSATFTVSNASTTFGPFAATTTTPGGNTLTSRSGVNTTGDITGLGINRFDVSIEVTKIPAPGSLALVGLVGLGAARRRR